MKKKETTYSMDGHHANYSEDFERDYLKDVIYLQEKITDLEQELLKLEIDMREAAKISVIKQTPVEHEARIDILPF